MIAHSPPGVKGTLNYMLREQINFILHPNTRPSRYKTQKRLKTNGAKAVAKHHVGNCRGTWLAAGQACESTHLGSWPYNIAHAVDRAGDCVLVGQWGVIW